MARQTRHSPNRYVWTTGSWLIYRFLEDAPARQRRLMEEAIEAGDIHWHALPFTMHSELMPTDVFRASLRFFQSLDSRFGVRTLAAKMTDVPGHTRGIVPILADAGVRFLHIGVNPASSVPEVPPCFRWRCGGCELVVVYEREYGSDAVLPGGFVLSVNLTNDNLGPHSRNEIDAIYSRLHASYPGADICAGGLDEAAAWVWRLRLRLPLVTEEIGDTWIHGVGSDPRKVSRFRELARFRRCWIDQGRWEDGSFADMKLIEALALTAEHTWGMDIKTHLKKWNIYDAHQLRRAKNLPAFKKVAHSWDEQRQYIDNAVSKLPVRLQGEIFLAFDALHFSRNKEIRKTSASKKSFGKSKCGAWTLALSRNGAVSWLYREGMKEPAADPKHLLGLLTYQTFSAKDYERFYNQYNTNDVEWAREDFKKWGLPVDVRSARHVPSVRLLSREGNRIYASLVFDSATVAQGAPEGAFLDIIGLSDGLDVRVGWLRKVATRCPESIWISFNPLVKSPLGWRIEKMGVELDPLHVVRNGNRSLHGVTGRIHNRGVSIESLDAVLVCPGKPRLLNFNNLLPDLRTGVSFNLFNNVWGTNFPMWNAEGATFRFQLRWKD